MEFNTWCDGCGIEDPNAVTLATILKLYGIPENNEEYYSGQLGIAEFGNMRGIGGGLSSFGEPVQSGVSRFVETIAEGLPESSSDQCLEEVAHRVGLAFVRDCGGSGLL